MCAGRHGQRAALTRVPSPPRQREEQSQSRVSGAEGGGRGRVGQKAGTPLLRTEVDFELAEFIPLVDDFRCLRCREQAERSRAEAASIKLASQRSSGGPLASLAIGRQRCVCALVPPCRHHLGRSAAAHSCSLRPNVRACTPWRRCSQPAKPEGPAATEKKNEGRMSE